MKVAVLGCGPAGLLVAHAVAQAGHELEIYSPRTPSNIGGAQFLHNNIPDITGSEPEAQVEFIHLGNAAGYAKKIYGDSTAKTSWHGYADGKLGIWNMREMYRKLWNLYSTSINGQQVTAEHVAKLVRGGTTVFSTIPRHILCNTADHTFKKQSIYIWYQPTESLVWRHAFQHENVIVYNGDDKDDWYRYSRLFGWTSLEWSSRGGWPNVDEKTMKDLVKISKPLDTNCNCLPEVFKFGRYGAWMKGQLVDNAYRQAVTTLARIEQGYAMH